MTARKRGAFGYFYVILAAVLWAASGSMAKYLFQSGVTPFQLVQLRTTLSTAFLFLWLLLWKRDLLKINRKDVIYFVLLGSALAVTQFTYLFAISRIHVAAAILLQYQSPVLIAVSAVLFARERLSITTVTALSGAILGCYLMVGAYNLDILTMNRAGILSGLVSAAAFAMYSVKSEYGMRTYSPWTVVVYALLVAAVIWNIAHPPLAGFSGRYGAPLWIGIVFIVLFGTVAAFGLYNEGIQRIRATHASITATLEPVIAGGISYFLVGEMLEPWQIMGAFLVIASIILLQIRKDTV
ncbi:MAG: DMT family transporter [bacterium]